MRVFWSRFRQFHFDNKAKGSYAYLARTLAITLLKVIPVIAIIIIAGKYIIDFRPFFDNFMNEAPNGMIFLVFLVSESTLGMIPPDFFVIWSNKFDSPYAILAILGVLSYIGGMLAYLIGYWLWKRPKIRSFSDRILAKNVAKIRKWGGVAIIASAIAPLSPFPLVVIAASLFRYPFSLYLIYGIIRIVRFILQGLLYLELLNMSEFFA
jgi:membrane protein YqaA with SNARE-associated domain